MRRQHSKQTQPSHLLQHLERDSRSHNSLRYLKQASVRESTAKAKQEAHQLVQRLCQGKSDGGATVEHGTRPRGPRGRHEARASLHEKGSNAGNRGGQGTDVACGVLGKETRGFGRTT